MTLYTIGFAKSTAEHFISRLNSAGVRLLFDTRLKTGGRLSGFAKDGHSVPSTTLNLYSHVVAGGRERAVAAASDTLRQVQAAGAECRK